jgi:hypothetical protein
MIRKNEVDPTCEWYALTKIVVEKMRARGISEHHLSIVPFAVMIGMRRQSSPPTLRH